MGSNLRIEFFYGSQVDYNGYRKTKYLFKCFECKKWADGGGVILRQVKGCVRYIFASLFLSLNESTCQTGKNVFYLTSNAFFVLEKINFRVLDFQIL